MVGNQKSRQLRPLMIDDVVKHRCTSAVEYAQRHPFFLGSGIVPGNDPSFVTHIDTYRCVFTFTHADGKVYRHLSVSVPGTKYPHIFAMWTIASLFGFTGWDEKSFDLPKGWLASLNEQDHCVVVMQAIERVQ